MVDVRYDRHVPDVLLLVHAFPHLVSCEVHLQVDSDVKLITKRQCEGKLAINLDITINIAYRVFNVHILERIETPARLTMMKLQKFSPSQSCQK